MAIPSFGPGAVVLTPTVKRAFYNERGVADLELTYKADKGKAYVVLLLGVCNKDDPEMGNPRAMLEALGWTAPKES